MYAIVEIAGKQYKVQEQQKLYVPRLANDIDTDVTFDRVLLVSGDSGIQVGAPTVADASVTARVLDHVKADKVIVFKKKRRKRYRVKNGHRQPYTQIEVGGISLKAKKKQKAKKTASAEKAQPEAEASDES